MPLQKTKLYVSNAMKLLVLLYCIENRIIPGVLESFLNTFTSGHGSVSEDHVANIETSKRLVTRTSSSASSGYADTWINSLRMILSAHLIIFLGGSPGRRRAVGLSRKSWLVLDDQTWHGEVEVGRDLHAWKGRGVRKCVPIDCIYLLSSLH